MAVLPERTAVYARISDDAEGRALGVARQCEDAHLLAQRLGWTLHPGHEPFIDNDISASTRSKKRRPAFERLMELVEIGAIDGIVYYSSSRLTRRPAEYERIIQTVEQTGVRLASVASGSVDLTTADGRMLGRMLAAQDAAYAERIGEQVTRAFKQRREVQGLPNPASRVFGFEVGGSKIRESEAEIIRRGSALILEGKSLGEVGRIWLSEGAHPMRAARWSPMTVSRALTNPRVAGLISQGGEVIGEGTFGRILDNETYAAVKEALASRRTDRVAAGRQPVYRGVISNLLTGFLTCGNCGNSVKVNILRDSEGGMRKDSFCVCTSGTGCRLKRNYPALLAFVEQAVRYKLETFQPAIDDIVGESSTIIEYQRLTVQRDDVETRMTAVREMFANGDLGSVDFVPTMRELRKVADALEVKLSTFEVADPVVGSDLMVAWDEGSMATRRSVLETIVEAITLTPIGKVGPVRSKLMIAETTHIDWRI